MSTEITGEQLTYVEVDLDLYRITRFEAARSGDPVARWSAPWNATHTFSGALSTAMPSGWAARLQKTTGNRSLLAWQAVPAIGDVSVVALFRPQSMPQNVGIVLRGSGGNGTDTGYLCRLQGTALEIGQLANAAYSAFANTALPLAANQNVWMRFDAVNVAGPGVLLRAKAWMGALSDEPSAFMIFFTDTASPFTGAGLVGLLGSIGEGPVNYLCGHFRARSLFGSELETLRFAAPSTYLPRDIPAVPNLTAATLNPAAISLGADLGKRAVLNVSFRDHPHADLGELYDAGTHWAKFSARGLFRRGQPIRLIRGLLGQTLEQMETRHFVLESFNGPTRDGGFAFTAQDVLKIADNDRAQAPVMSNGFLQAPIDVDDTSATLAPAGIGSVEYPASGYVAIGGKEVCAFTRAGDVLTLTRSAVVPGTAYETEVVAHDAEERVQLCLLFTAATPAAIANALLTQYASMSPSGIPLAAWETECATFLQRVYTRLIAEPTGVNKLLSELVEDAGLAMWGDEVANLVRMQVLRGVPTTAYLYDEANTLAGSIRVEEQRDRQITQMWGHYGVRNPLEPLDQTSNYRSTLVTIDTEGESLNGQAIIRKLYAPWIPAFARSTMQRVNDIHIGRFSTPPRKIHLSVQRYSGVMEPEKGGGYRVTWWGNQDEAGKQIAAPIQVTRVNPMADRIEAEAEEMLFKQFDPADLQDRVVPIDSNVNNINLRSLHDSIFPALTDADVTGGVTVTFVVNAGVIVGSTSTAAPAFDVGDWPAGFTPLLRLNGRIQGRGGNGGQSISPGLEQPGGAGGPALYTRNDLDLEYGVDAEVWGGAGGGAGGPGGDDPGEDGPSGGGGAGQVPGSAGATITGPISVPGQPGTTEQGGEGGDVSGGFAGGGDGGDPGQPGGSSTIFGTPFLPGGAAGAAIDGVSFVNVVSGSADVRGPTIN